MMLTILNLNQEGNVVHKIIPKIQIQIPSAGWRDLLAAFFLWFSRGGRLVWTLENANMKNSKGKQSAKK